MYIFMNLLLIYFWLVFFLFFYNFFNIFILFILSEMMWLLLFNFSIILSIFLDNYMLFMNNIFMLSFATMEFSIGFFLIYLIFNFNIMLKK